MKNAQNLRCVTKNYANNADWEASLAVGYSLSAVGITPPPKGVPSIMMCTLVPYLENYNADLHQMLCMLPVAVFSYLYVIFEVVKAASNDRHSCLLIGSLPLSLNCDNCIIVWFLSQINTLSLSLGPRLR